MRTKSMIFAMFFAAAAFVGCNKSEDGQSAGETQIMIVELPDGINTRVVEDASGDGDISALITNVHVFLMNGLSVAQHATFTSDEITNRKKEFENVSNSVSNVIVVANVPSGDETAVSGLRNANAIRNYEYSVADQQVGIKNLTLLGEGEVEVVNSTSKKAAVALNSLTARFEIGAVAAGVGIEEIHLKAVFINNYYVDNSKAEIKNNDSEKECWAFTGATAIANPSLSFPNAYSEPTYRNFGSGDVTVGGSKCYAFQVFAGANVPHIVLVVTGKYADEHYDKSNPANQYFAKYVTIKGYTKEGGASLTSIDANKIYKIGVGDDTGIVITPGGITEKPEEEEVGLTVNITIANWTAETLTPAISGN